MPKSDTWPGGTGLEPMPGIDSSGSCDSVLSTNSGFSDDSLEHLSAEEKACLMFLEETIDSLDTEDDSGLSNDESEPKPAAGAVASKQAELAASFSRTTSNSEQKQTAKHPLKTDANKHTKPSYLVPTPFVIANCTQPSTAAAKPSVTAKRNHGIEATSKVSAMEVHPKVSESAEQFPVPLEVDVIIPPKTQKPSTKAPDNSLQRGPLSYDALVYLRKNASEKKTPLCPTVDHTLESRHLPTTTAIDNGSIQNNISRFDRFHPEFSQSRTIPPAVPPKPKKALDSASSKTQTTVSPSRSFSVKRTPNPETVRQEALQKLGLIRETNETALPTTSIAKVQNGFGPAHFIKSSSNNNPTRSPSFCVTRLPAEPKSRGLHSSASFHHPSRSEQASATHNIQANRMKTGPPNIYKNEPHPSAQSEPSGGPNTRPSETTKPPSAVGYTVMVVPGMGTDRREALRKLGLLKD